VCVGRNKEQSSQINLAPLTPQPKKSRKGQIESLLSEGNQLWLEIKKTKNEVSFSSLNFNRFGRQSSSADGAGVAIPNCSLRIVCSLPHLIDFILYTKRFSNYKSAKISTKSKATHRGTYIKKVRPKWKTVFKITDYILFYKNCYKY